MNGRSASGGESPEAEKELRLMCIVGARGNRFDNGLGFLKKIVEERERAFEQSDVLDKEEARDIMKVYLKGCFADPCCLSDLESEGHYFVGRVRKQDGEHMAQLFLDKRSGHIVSIPHLYMKELDEALVQNL